MTDLGVRDDLAGSASPPGRESREDWRGGGGVVRNGRSPIMARVKRDRSRSRSPLKRSQKSFSPNREKRFSRDGTNTMSIEPHMERARLFVGNIEPTKTQRRDLTKLFSEYGDVIGVSVHKGYAFVQMDREKSANKAINFEDNKTFMGSKIHVEFSQAALKAGAKFERLSSPPRDRGPPLRDPSPPRNRGPPLRDHRSPPLRDHRSPPSRDHAPHRYNPHDIDDREREERLSRILQMEREIAILRSREGDALEPRKSRHTDHSFDSYDRRDGYRRSPPPNHGYQSYSRDHDRGEGGGNRGNGREYYNRQAPSVNASRGPPNEGGAYRDSMSYPSHFDSGRGSGGRSNYGRIAPSVGYGGSGRGGGKSGGPNSPLPPGWPSDDYDKSNANRPPFAGPWT